MFLKLYIPLLIKCVFFVFLVINIPNGTDGWLADTTTRARGSIGPHRRRSIFEHSDGRPRKRPCHRFTSPAIS